MYIGDHMGFRNQYFLSAADGKLVDVL